MSRAVTPSDSASSFDDDEDEGVVEADELVDSVDHLTDPPLEILGWVALLADNCTVASKIPVCKEEQSANIDPSFALPSVVVVPIKSDFVTEGPPTWSQRSMLAQPIRLTVSCLLKPSRYAC